MNEGREHDPDKNHDTDINEWIFEYNTMQRENVFKEIINKLNYDYDDYYYYYYDYCHSRWALEILSSLLLLYSLNWLWINLNELLEQNVCFILVSNGQSPVSIQSDEVWVNLLESISFYTALFDIKLKGNYFEIFLSLFFVFFWKIYFRLLIIGKSLFDLEDVLFMNSKRTMIEGRSNGWNVCPK